MQRLLAKLTLIGLPVVILTFLALGTRAATTDSDGIVPPVVSDDFRIEVDTNRNAYHTGEVLHLAVKLFNNSPNSVSLGICPVEAEPAVTVSAEDVELAVLDDTAVKVTVVPPKPIVIGYATLTRLGPSPVAEPALEADQTADVEPREFRLPLFDGPTVPGHSTRIISVANILIKGPLVKTVTESDQVTNETAKSLDVIPVIAKYIPVKPGYYLLDCHIEKICGAQPAQAQKIIRIAPRIIKPLPKPVPIPEPKPVPTPKPTPKLSPKTTR
jgi:hypothetical protein